MPLASRQNLNRAEPICQHAQQIALFKCDAALGWGKSRPRQMQENRAPTPAHHGHIIPAEHANQIVNRISAPKFFMTRRMRQADLRVVIGMAWIITPAFIGRDGRRWHGRAWWGQAIRAVEQATERQKPRWCRAIAFALIGADAALADGATINPTLETQQPIWANLRGSRAGHTLAQHMAKAARLGVQIGVIHAIRVNLMRFAAHHFNATRRQA